MSYTTQMDAAKKGIITSEMEIVAAKEEISVEELRGKLLYQLIGIIRG